jgi:hypothetical protein
MRRACLPLLVSLLVPVSSLHADSPRTIEFNRDVRPILSDKCFACHGPDKGRRKADLRLDVEKEAKETRDGGAAIVAGKPAESKLYQKITASNEKQRMPPAKFVKSLSPREIETLKLWIEQGAKWQEHWSQIAPKRPTLPKVADKAWARNAIDHFVLARLEEDKLKPAAEADRRTLIRRLTFDLTGLPPTPEEVDAFVNDMAPNAYEKVVDRLLTSKHFGERMAIYWLDVVRFADTAGYHSDNHRDITPYRDYVIRSFNDNKRFDRFTIEQLAGDLLPNATVEQRIASGYNRLLQTTEEGGAQAKEYLAKYSADRVRNTAVIWMGLTMGCCECHDHKFDPLTQRDFYSLAAFFADLQETAVGRQAQTPVPDQEYEADMKRLDAAVAEVRQKLATASPNATAFEEWQRKLKERLAKGGSAWTPIKPEKLTSSGGATLSLLDDLAVLSSGKNSAKDTYTVTLHTDLARITGIRLEALQHASLPGKGLSRGNGNYVLTGFDVEVQTPNDKKPKRVKLSAAVADFSQSGFPVESLLKDKGEGWAVDGHTKKENRQAVFTFAEPISGGAGTVLTIRMKQDSVYPQHNIGCFRLALTTADKPGLGKDAIPAAVVKAIQLDPEKRTQADKDALLSLYRSEAQEFDTLRKEIAKIEAERQNRSKAVPTSLVSMAVAPRPIRILKRGNWQDDSGEIVQPNTPASLPALGVSGRRATRLDLAKWMVAVDNPLPARVFVNRLWKLAFGQGIVRTLDDFGSQGTWPSHSDLLDWLAVEYRESGWDTKHMLKLMLMSQTYRQSSRVDDSLKQIDPYNYLLARQGRFRLDAEMVRDNALAVGGLLSKRIGGKSVKPYQPDGYWDYLNFPRRTWQKDTGDDQYRRGLYTYWQRTFLHPSLQAFDAPSREECTVERPRSNTPLQALVLLNDPTYVEAARAFAEKIVADGGADAAARIQFTYRRALGRPASANEVKLLDALYQHHKKEYAADAKAAEALLKVGDKPMPKEMDLAELAAWTSVARVVLNLHETITRN